MYLWVSRRHGKREREREREKGTGHYGTDCTTPWRSYGNRLDSYCILGKINWYGDGVGGGVEGRVATSALKPCLRRGVGDERAVINRLHREPSGTESHPSYVLPNSHRVIERLLLLNSTERGWSRNAGRRVDRTLHESVQRMIMERNRSLEIYRATQSRGVSSSNSSYSSSKARAYAIRDNVRQCNLDEPASAWPRVWTRMQFCSVFNPAVFSRQQPSRVYHPRIRRL